jgi:NADH pyrophosphatase NudC (nudix superfamily)
VTALALGTVLALLALGFVLVPLYRGDASFGNAGPKPVRRAAAGRERDDAVDALREIEFDQATGKLSDADYATMKATYTERALSAMRAADVAGVRPATDADVSPLDEAEAVISRFRAGPRSCAQCGPRPESDAAYCSSCGGYLAGRCAECDAPVREPGARFCSDCGHELAAA